MLVIRSFLIFSCAREGTSFFLINLSVADFLVCAVNQPLLVFRFNHPNQNKFFLLTQSFLVFGLFTASLNGLLTVTFDRFVAIYFPYKYVIWITEKITARLVLTAWMVSLMMGILNCIQGHPTDRFGKLSVRKALNPLQFSEGNFHFELS